MCVGAGWGKREGGETFSAARNASSSVVMIILTFPSIFGRNSELFAAITGSQPRARIVKLEASPPAALSPAPSRTSRSIESLPFSSSGSCAIVSKIWGEPARYSVSHGGREVGGGNENYYTNNGHVPERLCSKFRADSRTTRRTTTAACLPSLRVTSKLLHKWSRPRAFMW